ncbi:MAG: deoxyguanosinetriphosphate triphosphohydrolase, partial [Acidobacteriota bacterium]
MWFLIECIRDIIDAEVRDVVATSAAAIATAAPASAEAVRLHGGKLIRSSDELGAANRELRRFLYANVYY